MEPLLFPELVEVLELVLVRPEAPAEMESEPVVPALLEVAAEGELAAKLKEATRPMAAAQRS